MSYDEVTAEISKLRSKLSQKKSEFIEAKENVEELKSLFSDFENNDLDYNDEKYKEALSAFDSGDYITAQNLSNEAIEDSVNVESPEESEGAVGFFVVDEDACTRCALCVDRCPTGVITLGKFAGSLADQAIENGLYTAPWEEDSGARDDRHGYIYGRL